jgi:hypothetical protein
VVAEFEIMGKSMEKKDLNEDMVGVVANALDYDREKTFFQGVEDVVYYFDDLSEENQVDFTEVIILGNRMRAVSWIRTAGLYDKRRYFKIFEKWKEDTLGRLGSWVKAGLSSKDAAKKMRSFLCDGTDDEDRVIIIAIALMSDFCPYGVLDAEAMECISELSGGDIQLGFVLMMLASGPLCDLRKKGPSIYKCFNCIEMCPIAGGGR